MVTEARPRHDDSEIERVARQCQHGDAAAYRQLVALCAPRIHGTVYRLVGNAEDAEDVTQEVFIRLYTALPRFRWQSSFFTFLYSIVNKTCATAYQRRQRQPLLLTELEEADGTDRGPTREYLGIIESAETVALQRERQAAVHQAITRIPHPYRIVYVLSELEGYSDKEIAQVLHTNVGTVKSRLSRGREHFRKILWESRELFTE